LIWILVFSVILQRLCLSVQCYSQSCGRADSAFERTATCGRFRSSRRSSYLFPSPAVSLAKGRSSTHVDPEIRFDNARSLSPFLHLCLQSRPALTSFSQIHTSISVRNAWCNFVMLSFFLSFWFSAITILSSLFLSLLSDVPFLLIAV